MGVAKTMSEVKEGHPAIGSALDPANLVSICLFISPICSSSGYVSFRAWIVP